jgi:hypothetical protein
MVEGSHAHVEQKPTAQRNESIISEAIFGYDVSVVPIDPRQNFSTNLCKLPTIAAETHANYQPDVKTLDRQLAKEELSYYATGLMWLKMIDVKAKQGRQALTSAEKDIRKATMDTVFNVPQPIYSFISQIWNVTDKMGKETELEVPPLPVSQAQGYGGCHAPAIDKDSHNLFKEVPSLGIAGDMVMAVASAADEPEPNFHVQRPPGAIFTENLCGRYYPIGPRRAEIRQRLAS